MSFCGWRRSGGTACEKPFIHNQSRLHAQNPYGHIRGADLDPVSGNSGHILQVHHGADCVEFALVEDANTACGPNVYVGGTLNPECTALIPWYGIGTGEGVGQTPLTTSQLPFFIDASSAIDTAYRLYQSELQLEYTQAGIQGVIVINNPSEVASLDTTSAIGFTVNGTLSCKNISAATGTHTVNNVGNLNTPPSFFQVP